MFWSVMFAFLLEKLRMVRKCWVTGHTYFGLNRYWPDDFPRKMFTVNTVVVSFPALYRHCRHWASLLPSRDLSLLPKCTHHY